MPHPSLSSLPLIALRGFEATARLGSIKAAAEELGVTPSAVSNQVQALEAYLGATLFERLHRALRLTIAGEVLAPSVSAAFSDIGSTLEKLGESGLIDGGTTLSVSAAPTFAAKWLAPRLDAFQSLHPRIVLRLRAEGLLTDPGRDRQVDVAIRYGRGPYAKSLHAEQIWKEGAVVAVCSSSIAKQFVQPRDLAFARLLRTATPPGAGTAEPIGWAAWFAAAGEFGPEIDRAIASAPRVGTTQLALEAASAGRDVALSPMILVKDDLQKGRLQILFKIELPDPHTFWILHRKERAQEASLYKFITWLRHEAAA